MNAARHEPAGGDRQDLIMTHTFEAPHARIMAAWTEPKLPDALHSNVILTFAEDGPTTCVVLKYSDVSMISEEVCEDLQRIWEQNFVQMERKLKQGGLISEDGNVDLGQQSETPCEDVNNMGRLPRCEL